MDTNDDIRDSVSTNDQDRLLLHRREFMILSSVAVAGAAASGLPQQVMRAVAASDPVSLPIVSLGYWDGSFEKARIGTAFSGALHRLAAASSPRTGDRALNGSARVSVNGFWRAEQHRHTPVSLALNVMFPVGEERLPFHAWSHTTHRGVARNAPPPRFVVPVDARHPIEINVEMRMPAASTPPALARVKRFFSIDDGNDPQKKSGACSLALARELGLWLLLWHHWPVAALARTEARPLVLGRRETAALTTEELLTAQSRGGSGSRRRRCRAGVMSRVEWLH